MQKISSGSGSNSNSIQKTTSEEKIAYDENSATAYSKKLVNLYKQAEEEEKQKILCELITEFKSTGVEIELKDSNAMSKLNVSQYFNKKQ